MGLRIVFETENDAFRDPDDSASLNREAVAETLIDIAQRICEYRDNGPIVDDNGNDVGFWSVA